MPGFHAGARHRYGGEFMKKVLFTDLGNVLVSFWQRVDVLKAIAKSFDGDSVRVPELFRGAKAGGHQEEDVYSLLDEGKLSLEELFGQFLQVTGIQPQRLSYERFFALYTRHLEILPEVVRLYRQVNFPIVVISNGDIGSRHAADLVTCYGGLKFAHVFCSAEHGARKPELLALAARWMRLHEIDPNQCLFVDDIQKYCMAMTEGFGVPSLCFDATKDDVQVLQATLRQKSFL